MTLAELVSMLRGTGFPVAHSHFVEGAPSIPYITYLIPYTSNFIADNKVYHKINNAQIELYTEIKDVPAEKALEDILDANDIAYDADQIWIDSEQLFQKTYEVRLI